MPECGNFAAQIKTMITHFKLEPMRKELIMACIKLFWFISSAYGLSENEAASFRCNGPAAQFHKIQQSDSQEINVKARV